MSARTNTAVIHVETLKRGKESSPDLFRTAETRLEEAVSLAEAIELQVIFTRIVNLKKIDAGRLIGSGVIEEIKTAIDALELDLIVFNHALSPIQQRNLERSFNKKVIDRTALILEIFGERAATREGRLQVDAAALKYQKSRLVRSWTHLERQRGGGGFLGGPGETQIEADRRALDTQIQAIEKRLGDIRRTRSLHRARRTRNQTPVVALVGYTNAGKSTLFNAMSRAQVLAKDMLFATLDPVMRKATLKSGREIILSDTVGFIADLPTELVAAFRATLEEVEFADIILHVRDASHPEQVSQAKDVWTILNSLGIGETSEHPVVLDVLNKVDQVEDTDWLHDQYDAIKISAKTGKGLDELENALERTIVCQQFGSQLKIGHLDGQARAWVYEKKLVQNESYDEHGFQLTVLWSNEVRNRFQSQFPQIEIIDEGDQAER